MVQKCANPECKAEFRYVSRGRLFAFEIRHPDGHCRDVPEAICAKKPSHATIYFWLCENCTPLFTLDFTAETGLSVLPLSLPECPREARQLLPQLAAS